MKEDTIIDNNQETINASTANVNNAGQQVQDEATLFDSEQQQSAQQAEAVVLPSQQQSNGGTWAAVSLGGVSGILLGAAALYSVNAYGETKVPDGDGPQIPEGEGEDGGDAGSNLDNLSFSQAFAAARAEVGPGHTFTWHGGVYTTYTAEEWSTMTPKQQSDAHEAAGQEQQMEPIDPQNPPTDENPEVHVYVHVVNEASDGPDVVYTGDDPSNYQENLYANNVDNQLDGVQVVETDTYDGHAVAFVDTNDNGLSDVAIIDVDDDLRLSAPDIVVDGEGNYTTVGDLAQDDTYDALDDAQADDDMMYTASLDDADGLDIIDDAQDYGADGLMEA